MSTLFFNQNDARIAAGKSPLGFLNPFLYQNARALNDVTSGTNPGCGTKGFEASAGWDPVTGYANIFSRYALTVDFDA